MQPARTARAKPIVAAASFTPAPKTPDAYYIDCALFAFQGTPHDPNVGNINRIIRILAGIALIAWALWAWVGVLPLASGVFKFCPTYKLLGINACGPKK